MKQIKFLATVCVAVSTMVLFFSCNDGGEKKTTETVMDTSTAKPAATTPAPAAAAKPGNSLIIMHKVANYAKWKLAYDLHDSARIANGLHNNIVARGITDSNMVLIALRMDDAAKAREFTARPDLKTAMQKGGVIGIPSFNYVDVQMLDTSTNAQTTRVILTHKVKDWDAWKKEFDSHKQVRVDAGLTDRAVGYSVGDNHSVTVVCTVSDMKKAEAFFKSPDLKEKMAKAGVEGPPSIFFYKVAQKY